MSTTNLNSVQGIVSQMAGSTTGVAGSSGSTPTPIANTVFASLKGGGNFSMTGGRTALTDSATIDIDWKSSANFSVTLGGNRTLTFSNLTDGQVIVLQVKQDATGSRTLTYPATVSWAGGTAPTLTTTASKYDILCFNYNSSENKAYGAVVGQNY